LINTWRFISKSEPEKKKNQVLMVQLYVFIRLNPFLHYTMYKQSMAV